MSVSSMFSAGKYILLIFAISAQILLQTSCGAKTEEVGDSSSDDDGNPPVGVVTDDSFYVRVYDLNTYPYYVHKSGDFGSECSVATSQSSQDVTCHIDLNEGDAFFHGLSLQYNVPTSMCTYLSVGNYYYHNWETGYGPSVVEIEKDVNEDGDVVATTCTADDAAGNPLACSAHPEIASYDTDSNDVKCVYDLSDSDLPNCCLGNYTLTVTTNTDDDGDPMTAPEVTVITTRNAWGGDYKSCLSGPGVVDSDWPKTTDGVPIHQIYFTKNEGLNKRYDITGNIGVHNERKNYVVANYYTAADHTHNGFVSATTTNLPYAIAPIDDRDGSDMVSETTQDSYEFLCLDEAFEVINRIRVYVKEWNTMEEFLLYGSSDGASGDPDVTGDENTNCDYSTNDFECNDFFDWDDIPAVFGGYDTSGGNEAERASYFPSEE